MPPSQPAAPTRQCRALTFDTLSGISRFELHAEIRSVFLVVSLVRDASRAVFKFFVKTLTHFAVRVNGREQGHHVTAEGKFRFRLILRFIIYKVSPAIVVSLLCYELYRRCRSLDNNVTNTRAE